MNDRRFGPTGLRVSERCLGTMTFGEERGWGAPREEGRRIFAALQGSTDSLASHLAGND